MRLAGITRMASLLLLLLPAAATRSRASSGHHRIGRRRASSSVLFHNNNNHHRSSHRHHHHRHHPSSFVHRGSSPRSIAPASRDVGQPYSSSSSSSSSSSYASKSASSSTTSFEAPEPPSSHGASVFPDIDFRRSATTTTGEEKEEEEKQRVVVATTAATTRNADRDAVFVVNGSSRGIGLQFVIGLLERTEGKVLACCRSPSTSHELNDLSSRYPDRIVVLSLDVEIQESIDHLARTIATEYRRVDMLLNVAGILGDGGVTTPGPERSLSKLDRDWLMKTLSVNVVGPTMLVRALSPLMRTSGGRRTVEMMDGLRVELLPPPGHRRPPTVIVNLSARVGSISDNLSGGWYSYRMSKSALNQATRTMGHELARQGTWIVALHPGTTDTGLSRPFRRSVGEGRLFPVEFTVDRLLDVIESLDERNTGGFYDWAGKALPF